MVTRHYLDVWCCTYGTIFVGLRHRLHFVRWDGEDEGDFGFLHYRVTALAFCLLFMIMASMLEPLLLSDTRAIISFISRGVLRIDWFPISQFTL